MRIRLVTPVRYSVAIALGSIAVRLESHGPTLIAG